MRSGPRAMIASAIFGGIILACMEGVGVLIGRMSADSYKPQAPQMGDIAAPTNPDSKQALPQHSHNDTPLVASEKKGFKFF